MSEYQCYNKGCGNKYNPANNTEDSCCYHPGEPIFHDAYKGWSCCNKRSTDFTTFLNTKGCSHGKHSSEKIDEPAKRSIQITEIAPEPSKPVVNLIRPDINSQLTRLPITVTQSLKQALEKIKSNSNEKETEKIEETSETRIGESCKNNACKITYEGDGSNLEMCKHHPGIPIFHEGMKYWSCCQRKTCDFDTFLDQEGCMTGSHIWSKKAVQQADCRYDWHQTGANVYMTVYAKSSVPEFCVIDVNPVRLICEIVFDESSEFKLDIELDGMVDPSNCKVTLAATKVEIQMKKAEAKNWSKLGKETKVRDDFLEEEITEEKLEGLEVHPSIDLKSIDLSDI